jgi:hypothetical protein
MKAFFVELVNETAHSAVLIVAHILGIYALMIVLPFFGG